MLAISYWEEATKQDPLYSRGTFKTLSETLDTLEGFRFPLARILGYNPEFSVIRLDIKQKHYRKLEFASAHDRSKPPVAAIRRDVKVPAVLRLDSERTAVKLRLKGDRALHWASPERWSFRVEVKGDKTFLGMKRFSLHHAVARNYVYEWLFHTVLKREGIIGLRYRFVTLHVNGTSQGIYALEDVVSRDRVMQGEAFHIKQKHYRKLEFASAHDRSKPPVAAIRRDVKVPAVLRLDSERTAVKLRLKGDRALHWASPERWSFRVEVKGDKTFLGMKRFSLHHAVARNYVYEWLFHTVLKREGIIGLRYRFVTLHVNGTSQGIYALEENFDKRLLENNKRREGPILKFAEDWFAGSNDIFASASINLYERQNGNPKIRESQFTR